MSAIGESVLRLEDPPLLTGRGRFVADLSFPHQLHMRVVRSGRAHGRIRGIDTAAALAAPGVAAVWAHRDVADLPPIGLREGIGTRQADITRLTPYLQPVLARELVLAHGGRISGERPPQGGFMVRVAFPAPPSPTPSSRGSGAPGSGPRRA